MLLSPDSYGKKPCYYCFLTAYRNGYLPYAPHVRAELAGKLSRVEGFMFMWENASQLKSQQLVCLNENFIKEVLRSRVKLSKVQHSHQSGSGHSSGMRMAQGLPAMS